MNKIFKISGAIILGAAFASFAAPTMADDALSAVDLAQEAKANRMRFDKKLKDMQFDVQGEIFKIDEKQGKYVVYLHGNKNGNPFDTVACEFDPQYEDAILKMDKGNVVTLHCDYRGKAQFEMGAFTLVNCSPK